ncbi:hypothetical protein [Marinifilum fragile]|uniref:hypothetical protein n=1 Tax=Marinifilum fragile TaxID=570161 RepID=UPI0006D151C7|nr:hypothetical protein [Marinifilum fragile]
MGGRLDSGVYNLVEYNKSVMELVENIQKNHPNIEMNFTNQHLELPQQMVKIDERILKLYNGEKLSFEEEMIVLKNHFETSSI